jgi:hypothetical protein
MNSLLLWPLSGSHDLAENFRAARRLLSATLLHFVHNGDKNIGKTQDAHNFFTPGDQKRLVMSHDQLMKGFAQRCILGHIFALAGRIHEFLDVFFPGLAADILQWIGKEMILLQHGIHELLGEAKSLGPSAFDHAPVFRLQGLEQIHPAELADDITLFIEDQNQSVALTGMFVLKFFPGFSSSQRCFIRLHLRRPLHTMKAGPSIY